MISSLPSEIVYSSQFLFLFVPHSQAGSSTEVVKLLSRIDRVNKYLHFRRHCALNGRQAWETEDSCFGRQGNSLRPSIIRSTSSSLFFFFVSQENDIAVKLDRLQFAWPTIPRFVHDHDRFTVFGCSFGEVLQSTIKWPCHTKRRLSCLILVWFQEKDGD